ncbi:RNA-binding protein 5-like [Neocloeon triangulifer]|uniref:RNA-binding protein 5-like n=1 Tax=Neocloeon triangulifer TaxID=2078957 RepID=UPI00286EF2D2|nr:RNA-binding protein 5-like [Neocloeon triangulifer]
MEGLLWKWTNYWNGWQTRWFVLADDGTLSYYNTKEEMGQGCKGSMKVSACEIIVHPVDCSRMDIVIPGEQHMYLKAPSPSDRQRWLVALGSCKACLNTAGPRRNSGSDIEKQLEKDWERRHEKRNTSPSSPTNSRRGRSRERSPDRRGRRRSSSREKRRDRSRGRSRSHSRERSRDRSRDRHRSRDRSRSRDRHRGRDRERRREKSEKNGRSPTPPSMSAAFGEGHSTEFYKTQAPNNTILIRGLATSCSENDLRREIMSTGLMPKDIRLIRKRETGESRGFAFLEFASVMEAKQWMELKGGTLTIAGEPSVAFMQYSFPKSSQAPKQNAQDWFCLKCTAHNFKRRDFCFKCNAPKAEQDIGGEGFDEVSPHPTYTLLLRGLDVLTTEETVLQSIQGLSAAIPIRSIRIDRDTLTNTSRGVCYVELNCVQDAMALHSNLMAAVPLIIDEKTVTVSYCKLQQRATPSSVSQKPMKYTSDEINQMAEYSAQMYATNEEEFKSYKEYYLKYYENELKEGRTPVRQDASANAAAAVAQNALAQLHAKEGKKPVQHQQPQPQPQVQVQPMQMQQIMSQQELSSSRYQYDETSGFYYDSQTGLYYDPNTQYFYNSQTQQYVFWDLAQNAYVPVPGTEEKEDNKKKKDKVKVAKKIAKDMERWAKSQNRKKEAQQMQQQMPDLASMQKAAVADIGFAVLERREMNPESGASPFHNREDSPTGSKSGLVAAYGNDSDSEDESASFTDWSKMACLLCKRQFPNKDTLVKHQQLSSLHKENLAKLGLSDLAQNVEYRDRAKERRKKFGQPEVPNKLKERYLEVKEATTSNQRGAYEEPVKAIGNDNIGSKLLQKMGWSEGMGLGKTNQGRTDIIEAKMRTPSVGLGAKSYGIVPGESSYKESVKKMAYMRYQELAEQEKH